MSLPAVNKNNLDVAQIFQTFMLFAGDLDRAALASASSRVRAKKSRGVTLAV